MGGKQLLSTLLLTLLAIAPVNASEYWGEVTHEGEQAGNGLSVAGFYGSTEIARMPGGTLNGFYYLKVPADVVPIGDEIELFVGGNKASPNLIYNGSSIGRVDVFVGCVETWECTDWSDCADNNKIRVCTDTNSCGSTVTKPEEVDLCVSECIPRWDCSAWEECSLGTQQRQCADLHDCGDETSSPQEERSCDVSGANVPETPKISEPLRLITNEPEQRIETVPSVTEYAESVETKIQPPSSEMKQALLITGIVDIVLVIAFLLILRHAQKYLRKQTYLRFMDVHTNPFRIIVKPNAKRSRFVSYNEARNAYVIDIKGRAENNEANIEVIKFFTRVLKRRVSIIHGLHSREKIIKIKET